MATKLKVNFYGIGFKLAAFLLILLGVAQLSLSAINIEDIALYFNGDNFIRNHYKYNQSWELRNALWDFYSDSSTPEEKNFAKSKMDEFVRKGYCYAICDKDSLIVYEGSAPKPETLAALDALSGQYNSRFHLQDESPTLYMVAFQSPQLIEATRVALASNFVNGRQMFYLSVAALALFFMGLLLTGLLCGRKEPKGALTFRFYERVYNDILLLFSGCLGVFLIFCGSVMWYNILSEELTFPMDIVWFLTALLVLTLSILIYWTLSCLCKRTKNKALFQYTLTWKMIRQAWHMTKVACLWIVTLYKKCWNALTSPFVQFTNKTLKRALFIGAGCLFTACILNAYFILILNRYNSHSYFFIFWVPLSYAFILAFTTWLLFKQMANLAAIKKGCAEIRKGHLAYKIPILKIAELNLVAEDINHIGDGFQAAVKNATVSEKMKTELITNVSHDLKTPLTSIISYVDLLSKEKNLSETSRDYIAVLKSKSERLKSIISDLFDLSKGTSGNAELTIERLDMQKLIVQILAEMEDRTAESGHPIKQTFPETEVYIYGDGKRLYRVFQNIFDNALKYSMPETRIFVNLSCVDGKVLATVQNIASYEMNFTEFEILERFSRGDKARGGEGTGLGLSIAETFTTLCGGKFNVQLDGDQFKVLIEFPQA